jgi:branched-chain amino acid transport system permease protein
MHANPHEDIRSSLQRFTSVAPLWLRLTVLSAFFCLLPLVAGNYWTHVLAHVGIYIILGIGLNVTVGFAGLLDLGYVAFFAVGAYTYGLLASPQFGFHVPFWFMLPVCALVAAMGGILLGIPVLRMRGDYLAIVTLGFGQIVRILLNNLDGLTNGPKGLLRIDPPSLGSFQFSTPLHYYYLILATCVFAAFAASRLNQSRVGRAWAAMREDQDAAALMGINVLKYKLMAFAIGACFAGVGGVIFAARQGSIFPDDFSLMISINVLCLIIIGGMGSIPGVILGAVVLIGIPEVLRGLALYRMLAFGALLVIMMVFRPSGLLPAARLKAEMKSK